MDHYYDLGAYSRAISTNSEATCGTGKNPRAVLPMKLASCGCRESRKMYVRSLIAIC